MIVSDMNGALWIKPSRPVPVSKLKLMLLDALNLLSRGNARSVVITPEDCQLQAWITVNTDQKLEDASA